MRNRKVTLDDLRFSANAYFYKLKEGGFIRREDVEAMLRGVTSSKESVFLVNEVRQSYGEMLVSCRVFKNKPNKPLFLVCEVSNCWKEQKVGYYLFVEYRNYIAILRKYAAVPKSIAEKLEQIDYNDLIALYAHDDTKFNRLSLQNLYGSQYAMRSKTYEALDLRGNVSAMGAGHYCVRTVKGENEGEKFSLALNSSRINKFTSELSVKNLCEWIKQTIDSVADLEASKTKSFLSIFARPEKYGDVRSKLEPNSLLVFYNLITYLNEDDDVRFYHIKNDKKMLISKPVVDNYAKILGCSYSIKRIDKAGKIKYFVGHDDHIEVLMQKSGIKLRNKTWENIEIEGSEEYDGTLLDLINKWNQFNVYFVDTELIYNNGELFRDSRLLQSVLYFMKVFQVLPELENTTCEKHTQKLTEGLNDWDANSIFKLVEDNFQKEFEYFICDDYGKEWADHIGVAEDKVSFFVSKHNNSRDSAADFQDVVGQALKNLGNLMPTQEQFDEKRVLWSEKYLRSNMQRLRFSKGSVADAIDMWRSNVSSPNFVREMCLVVDFLSCSTFSEQLSQMADGKHPQCEASLYQRLWLLSSFVGNCLEMGIVPKIYCKP